MTYQTPEAPSQSAANGSGLPGRRSGLVVVFGALLLVLLLASLDQTIVSTALPTISVSSAGARTCHG